MSIQYGRIGKQQLSAFLPLLPENQQELLRERDVYAAGAVKDGYACGVLLFRANSLTADMLHLAVAEPYRRQGIANGLIDCLCESAWQTGTAVLATFAAADRSEPICRLLTRRGDFTIVESEDYICRIPCDTLTSVPLHAAPPAGSRIEPFYKLPEGAQHSFLSHLREENAEFVRGLQEERRQMLEPLCLCVTGHGTVQAAVFCQNQEGSVLLSFAYARSGHSAALVSLVSRLRELLTMAAAKVPYLYIAAVTPESRKLVEKLLPQREIVEHFYTAGWDMNTMGG